MIISGIRRSYERGALKEEDMPAKPLELFEKWLHEAVDEKLADPTGMVVATVDGSGMPCQRSVLLKKFDERGFVFFTNLTSRKARQIEGNSAVSLLFPWYPLERQVHVQGRASKISAMEVVSYFTSRPRDSQIGAWVSHQSSVISARSVLEAKFFELKSRFSKGEIPVPSFWGGYRVSLETIEFWQGGKNRLHDRFLYTKEGESWKMERLAP
ncbi:MAG: pyridoxamine 5'-phosphate oxidase [Succinivibrionaceae bacterium]|nr:pyridoxamine 5'-phosphate oxidase [Succinivibrionaceae bacterium]